MRKPSRASTTSPLPLLPEPRLQTRSTRQRQRSWSLSSARMRSPAGERSGLPSLSNTCTCVPASPADADLHAILRRRHRLVLAEDLGQEALLILGLRLVVRVEIADEVDALGAIAVLDGESAAIERQSDATPGTVERIVDVESIAAAVGALDDARALRCRAAAPAAGAAPVGRTGGRPPRPAPSRPDAAFRCASCRSAPAVAAASRLPSRDPAAAAATPCGPAAST